MFQRFPAVAAEVSVLTWLQWRAIVMETLGPDGVDASAPESAEVQAGPAQQSRSPLSPVHSPTEVVATSPTSPTPCSSQGQRLWGGAAQESDAGNGAAAPIRPTHYPTNDPRPSIAEEEGRGSVR